METMENLADIINATVESLNESDIILKSKRESIQPTIATIIDDIFNSTPDNITAVTSVASNASYITTAADGLTEILTTTLPPPDEPPCEQYWYDLNTTTVYHVSQVSRGTYASISFIFLVVFVSSVFMNCMLLAVIGKYDGLKNPLRMLLLNLAACDLVATLLGVFMTMISNAMGYFYFGMTACKIEGFITFFCGSTRLLSLMLMLVERYLVICNPLAGATFDIKQSMIASGCCWLWSCIWCMLPLIGWNHYALEGIGTSCAPNWYSGGNGAKFTICFLIVVFITPLLVKIYLFGMTLSFIRVQSSTERNCPNQVYDILLWKMVLGMVVVWLIGWMPYICYILSIMISKTAVDENVYSERYAFVAFPSVIARVSFILNPLIQLAMDSEIRAQTVVVLTSGNGLEHALIICRNKQQSKVNKVTPITDEPTIGGEADGTEQTKEDA